MFDKRPILGHLTEFLLPPACKVFLVGKQFRFSCAMPVYGHVRFVFASLVQLLTTVHSPYSPV
jgi:hypothetical protein